jgi:hypothetical protein
MELKQLIANFTYRIEPKPEGGFTARSSDPSLPVLQAATRKELQEKMQARISAAVSAAFPGLNLPIEKNFKFAFHMEPNPGGGYIAQPVGPDSKPIEGAMPEEPQQHLAEKVAGALCGYLVPQLPKAFRNLNSKDVKVLFNISSTAAQFKTGWIQKTGRLKNASDKSPIQPEIDGSWTIFRILLIVLVVASLMYFFLRHL